MQTCSSLQEVPVQHRGEPAAWNALLTLGDRAVASRFAFIMTFQSLSTSADPPPGSIRTTASPHPSSHGRQPFLAIRHSPHTINERGG